MNKPILMILGILLSLGTGLNAATTDFTRIDPAYFKLESITTTVTESSTGEENSVNINVRVNRCVETIIITTECFENKERQNISTISSVTRTDDCE